MKEDILKECKVEGNVVKLPPYQLQRDIYLKVKKHLENIGGKWKGGKTQGFIFQTDPTTLLEQIANGERRNIKKEFQFYETPKPLADDLASLVPLTPVSKVLEPSAGTGALIKAIHRLNPGIVVDCYELMDDNRDVLQKLPNINILGADFFECNRTNYYDVVIANPPFNHNQDIDHIRKMYDVVKPGGIILSVSSYSWTFGSQKKQKSFREWLRELNCQRIELDQDAFKESKANARSVLLKIHK